MNQQEIQHYGIPGMRWGIRKSPDVINREKQKMQAIARRGSTASRQSDITLAKRATSPLIQRTAKTSAVLIMNTLVGQSLTGNISKLSNPKYAAKIVAQIAGTTAANIAIENALAKSMAKNYTDSGRMKPGLKDRAITKQDSIAMAISAAPYVVTGIAAVSGMKLQQANATRSKNEQRFNDFANNSRILDAPISGLGEVIFSNSQYTIYDRPR